MILRRRHSARGWTASGAVGDLSGCSPVYFRRSASASVSINEDGVGQRMHIEDPAVDPRGESLGDLAVTEYGGP